MTYKFITPKTQKAKGILLLQNGHSSIVNFATIRPPQNVTLLSLDAISHAVTFPCFARPCPMRPRHGFVESRLVNDMNDLMAIWDDATQADADAEVILMPMYSGRLSAVAHSSSVVWGKGHDGATAGNGALNIPCPGLRYSWKHFTGSSLNIGIQNEGWIELVENAYDLIAVQLRDGPIMETHSDFIPASCIGMDITTIVTVNDLDVSENDPNALLLWETYIASFASVPGVVIALPNKTLASHFAVHGIVAGIPVICSETGIANLKIGSQLEGVSSIPPLCLADIKNIAAHSEKTKAMKKVLEVDWLLEALGTLHASNIWDNQAHLLRLRANMPIVLTRFLAAAALGELRHFRSFRHNGFTDLDFTNIYERNHVYEKMFTIPWASIVSPLKFCASKNGFACDAQKTSYGGPKWARISKTAYRLHCQYELFCRAPTVKRWNNIIKTCNIGVNLAHNGGNILTKWLPKSHLDLVANCPGIGFLNITAGEHCLQLPERKV